MTRSRIRRPAVLLSVAVFGSLAAAQTRPALPFAGTDVVTTLNEGGSESRWGGTIEQISGDRLTLRGNGRGDIRMIRITDISQISFSRGVDWDEGSQRLRDRDFRQALVSFDQALRKERREWAWRELQATAAKTAVHLGDRWQAVERIETILVQDERSRHVSLLPLVWDERLPPEERITAEPDDLTALVPARRLVAASALLHQPEHQPAARSVLQQIRRTEGLSRMGDLAQAQLWRLSLLGSPDEPDPPLRIWADRVRDMPVEARPGPQYVVSRAFLQKHDYDAAALGFLWMPLMAPTDEALAAQSLAEAIHCLKLAGRPQEAVALRHELQSRFPDSSAARRQRDGSEADDQSPAP